MQHDPPLEMAGLRLGSAPARPCAQPTVAIGAGAVQHFANATRCSMTIIKKAPSPRPSSKIATKKVGMTTKSDLELATGATSPGLQHPLSEIDKQIEQHALNVERVQREAVFDIGRELAAAQDLFKYS